MPKSVWSIQFTKMRWGLPSSDTEIVGPVSEVSLQAPSAVSEVVPPVEEFNVSPAIHDALMVWTRWMWATFSDAGHP